MLGLNPYWFRYSPSPHQQILQFTDSFIWIKKVVIYHPGNIGNNISIYYLTQLVTLSDSVFAVVVAVLVSIIVYIDIIGCYQYYQMIQYNAHWIRAVENKIVETKIFSKSLEIHTREASDIVLNILGDLLLEYEHDSKDSQNRALKQEYLNVFFTSGRTQLRSKIFLTAENRVWNCKNYKIICCLANHDRNSCPGMIK